MQLCFYNDKEESFSSQSTSGLVGDPGMLAATCVDKVLDMEKGSGHSKSAPWNTGGVWIDALTD